MKQRSLRDALQRRSASRVVAVAAGAALGLGVMLGACATDDHIVVIEETRDGSMLPETDGQTPDETDAGSATCGNGTIEAGETCDDGNTTDGDGCSATCAKETVVSSCPGTNVPLTVKDAETRVGSVSGDTGTGNASLATRTCGGGSGKDLVYSFRSDVPGRAKITLEAAFDSILSARTDCAVDASELGCQSAPLGGGTTQLVVPVAANKDVFVVVDGGGGKSGTFKLDIEVGVTTCGDGIAQVPEQCDDGNTAPGDGCSADCQLESVGSASGTCPGFSFGFPASTVAKTVSFAGDTLASDKSNFGAVDCTSTSAREQIWAVTPAAPGALSVKLAASFPEATLHIRRECFTSATQVDCKTGGEAGEPIERTFPVLGQNTYFVFIDGADSNKSVGPYTLDVTYIPEACGDGILQGLEQCDDGNTTSGDGCTADCKQEPMPPATDACPGLPIVWSGPAAGPSTFHVVGNTSGSTVDVGTNCGSNGTKDVVYTVVAPYHANLTAKVTADFNASLSLRKTCVPDGSKYPTPTDPNNVACANDDTSGRAPESLRGAVDAGETYFLTIKGGQTLRKTDGNFALDVELTPSVCGNGVVEGGETCDDGGRENGDACDADCTIEPVPALGLSCETAQPIALTESMPGVYGASVIGGNWNMDSKGYFAAPCAAAGKEVYYTVTPPVDGVVQVVVDDASYDVSIGVRPQCPPNTSTGFLACSNRSDGPGNERFSFIGKKDTKYWVIVDASRPTALGRFKLDVTLQDGTCGDGLVSGSEECDDGGNVDGDGCDKTCKLETVAGADRCPGAPVTLTGTGTATRSKVVTLSTAALASDYAGTCGGNFRDGVFAVTSDIAGTMKAQLTASWPTVLYARGTCDDATTEYKCAKSDVAKPNETTREITFPVKANTPAYIFIDGIAGGSGPASLALTVTP